MEEFQTTTMLLQAFSLDEWTDIAASTAAGRAVGFSPIPKEQVLKERFQHV